MQSTRESGAKHELDKEFRTVSALDSHPSENLVIGKLFSRRKQSANPRLKETKTHVEISILEENLLG
jgi:hypothetical protein